MAKRYVGQSTLIESNRASSGMVEGSQIGKMLPGKLESLQESAYAKSSNSLYYPEALGQFNAPSFQRCFGVKNSRVDNIDRWGSSGTFTIDNDIFWNGPAALQIKVPLKQRWAGPLSNQNINYVVPFRPSFFYSWGAGFAAVKYLRMNMGGAGEYTLDRYANYVGVMCSCFSVMQRYELMKLSGGGVIDDTAMSGFFGLKFETATYGTVTNKGRFGEDVSTQVYNAVIQKKARIPVEDNWIVPFKTPHTNYQNPRTRRLPIDTKLFSEHFTVDVWLSNFDEVCDSGTGVPIVNLAANVGGATGYQFAAADLVDLGYESSQHYRQYQNIYGNPNWGNAGEVLMKKFDGTDVASFLNTDGSEVGDIYLYPLDSETLSNNIGSLLTPETLPELEVSTLVSSMRLTNDLLGAYDVLKTRTDQAVYYPFQHFTTQVYSVRNGQFGGFTLDDMIKMTDLSAYPANERTSTPITHPINIPVNPMSAMYIAVAREKDRYGLGISTPGGYSPCLFWNLLELPYLEVTYGATPLLRYSNTAEYLSEQTYEHCSPLQIPYMGGLCLRTEQTAEDVFGKYKGVLRNSWIYEVSFVEMEPLRDESFFQQTPSFQGEQLNVSFRINPSTLVKNNYEPSLEMSYISNYKGNQGLVNAIALRNFSNDMIGAQNAVNGSIPGIPNTELGTFSNTANVWHLNNDQNLMLIVVYAQNALWQLNPNASKIVFARG